MVKYKPFTDKIRFNIMLLGLYRVINIVTSLILTSLLVRNLDSQLYGLWVTMLSIIIWIKFFDFGIGNGLRNKLTEALSINDVNSAKSLIVSSILILSFASVIILCIFLYISSIYDWNNIFNVDIGNRKDINTIMLVIVIAILINMIFSVSSNIEYATHNASRPETRVIIFNILFSLCLIILLVSKNERGLIVVSLFYLLSTLLAEFIFSFQVFRSNKQLIPTNFKINKKDFNLLSKLGIKFFALQLSAFVLFGSDNIIIAYLFGVEEVTPYNLISKIFGIIIMGHIIIITPLWSAFTEKYNNEDFVWIKNIFKKLNLIMFPLVLASIIIAIFMRQLLFLWVGKEFEFTDNLIIFMLIYTLIVVWNNNYAFFLKGVSKIRLTIIITIPASIINIPISIYLAINLQFGVAGIILGTIISLMPGFILGPLQTFYLLKPRERKGILNFIFSK